MTKIGSTAVGLFCLLLVGVAGYPAAASAEGTMLFGVVRSANTLVLFDSSNPSVVSSIPITGLPAGEVIRGIDVRPATGALYGLATPDGVTNQLRLYTINPITGVATAVGPAVNSAISGNFWGMSFNAVADRVRVVSSTNANLRLNPDTGGLAALDVTLTDSSVTDSVAYDNQFVGATQTTLYAIRVGVAALARIGGPQGILRISAS